MKRGMNRIKFWALALVVGLVAPALHAQYMGGGGGYGGRPGGGYGGNQGNNNNQGRYGNNNNQGRYGNNSLTSYGSNNQQGGNQQGGNQQGGNQQGGNQQGGGQQGGRLNNMYLRGIPGMGAQHISVANVPAPLRRSGGSGGNSTGGGYARINLRGPGGLGAAGGRKPQKSGGARPTGGGTTKPGTTKPGGGGPVVVGIQAPQPRRGKSVSSSNSASIPDMGDLRRNLRFYVPRGSK